MSSYRQSDVVVYVEDGYAAFSTVHQPRLRSGQGLPVQIEVVEVTGLRIDVVPSDTAEAGEELHLDAASPPEEVPQRTERQVGERQRKWQFST